MAAFKQEVSVKVVHCIPKLEGFLYGEGPRYSHADVVKLGKALENLRYVLAKIVRKAIFSKMKLAGLLMKKRASFPSKICPIF